MSELEVRVRRVRSVEPHPNADRLDLVKIDGYTCVCQKGLHKEGNLVAYIPEQAVLPNDLLKEMGFWKEGKGGTLGGPEGNVVKPVKLRGVLSQGVVIPTLDLTIKMGSMSLGDDLTERLGITKYEAPIPPELQGAVENIPVRFNYDIEDIKKYPDVLQPGEQVYITEKRHGSLGAFIMHEGKWWISTKGLLAKGLAFKQDVNNSYTKAILPEIYFLHLIPSTEGTSIIFGEVFGPGIQDLHYGEDQPQWEVFDAVHLNQDGIWEFDLPDQLENNGLPYVPPLYKGPWSPSLIETYVNGQKSFTADHVREGVVIRALPEREDMNLGRVVLKSINPDYLTRKGGTEYQ